MRLGVGRHSHEKASGLKIGIALSGGGAAAMAHVGVFEELSAAASRSTASPAPVQGRWWERPSPRVAWPPSATLCAR